MKKRLLSLLLCASVVFSVCACGDSNTEDTEATQTETVEKPSVTKLADYTDWSVVLSGEYEITDEVVASYFSDVLYNVGVGLVEVTDRDTVQDGDIVVVDYTGYLNGEAFTGGSATSQWIDVSNNTCINSSTGATQGAYIDGFSAGILGAKVDETVSSDVTFPEDYSSEDLAGQLATFEFKVYGIYTEVTMENITDEFVAENLQEFYEVATVDELVAFLQEDIAYNYLINYLIDNSTYDISEEYLYYRLEDYQDFLADYYYSSYGVDLETFLSYSGYTLDEAQVEWLEEVQGQIKAELIFSALVEDKGLSHDEDAHQEYLDTVISASSVFADAEAIYKYISYGNAEAGEIYLKDQQAVRDVILEDYRSWSAQ